MLCDVEIILTIFKWGGTQKYSNDANPSPLTTRICLVTFLAAMSSSRSDVVTQFVRSSVRPSFRTLFFLLVSWEFYLVLKSFNGVSRKS